MLNRTIKLKKKLITLFSLCLTLYFYFDKQTFCKKENTGIIMDIFKVFAAFLCILGICTDPGQTPTQELIGTPQDVLSADLILNESQSEQIILEEFNKSEEDENISNKTSENNIQDEITKFDITNITTLTIQTCEDATFLIRKKLGLGLKTVLSIEKKCEYLDYYEEKIVPKLLANNPVETISQTDCTSVKQRITSIFAQNEEDYDNKKKDEKRQEQKVKDFEEEGKTDQAGKQRDDLKETLEDIEFILKERERLLDIQRMVNRNC